MTLLPESKLTQKSDFGSASPLSIASPTLEPNHVF